MNINSIKQTSKFLVKAVCYIPFILPYRAFEYGTSKFKKSLNRGAPYDYTLWKDTRYEMRATFGICGAGLGLFGGGFYGGMLGTMIFPGGGTIVGTILGIIYGGFLGACFGMASGVLVAKLATKLVTGLRHLYAKARGTYGNALPVTDPAQLKQLPPVNFSNQAKYRPYAYLMPKNVSEKTALYYYQSNYDQRDVWRIMSFLYQHKQENKHGMNTLLILSQFSKKHAVEYQKKKQINAGYNAALEEARQLKFVCPEPLPEGVPKPAEAAGPCKVYQLQIGGLFDYYVKGASPDESVDTLRSKEFLAIVGAPSPTR
ncbi:MAG TPA: hypothetical protein VLH77_03345 [Gammaproteobacteria bacterium]|nr:hypothetical protein [Gammaproteobacteria bacterium]